MSAPDFPNILWICTDQQRYDTLGCTGNPLVATPHLDRLAAGGVLCEQAFCQNPLCTPSRGSFLTGRYPTTNRLTRNGQICPPDLRILPRDLRDAGYINGLIGKLHLNACDNRLALGPDWEQADPRLWFKGAERRIDDGYDVFLWDHHPNGENPASAYTQWLWERTGGHIVSPPPHPDSAFIRQGRPVELRQGTWAADQAVRFIASYRDRLHPWLLSVNLFDPHPPFDAPDSHLARYRDRLGELPPVNYVEGELRDAPPHHRAFFEGQPHTYGGQHLRMTTRDHQWVRASYYAMVDLIDEQVGRILAALDATGQRDNTLIIFMSDHGELLGDHGLWPKGPFLYDPAMRVPLIFAWPGRLAAGRRLTGLVELTDLVPTLRDLLGLPADPAVQGQSFADALQGKAPAGSLRDDVYAQYPNSNPHHRPLFLDMIRTRTHKLVACHGSHDGELYDLSTDPGENHNRWRDPACTEVKLDLLGRLARRMALTADPMPPRIGVY